MINVKITSDKLSRISRDSVRTRTLYLSYVLPPNLLLQVGENIRANQAQRQATKYPTSGLQKYQV